MPKIKKKAVKTKKVVKKKVKKVKAKKSVAVKKVAAPKKAVKVKKTKAVTKAGTAPLASLYKPAANETLLGEVEDYFSHIGVIALHMKAPLALGQIIHVHGHTTDATLKVESMQIEHQAIQTAKKGDSVGIKVSEKCRKGDKVFRVN